MSYGHKAWAYALMVREAGGEQINIVAAKFWREALGYSDGVDARQTLEAVKKAQKEEKAA